MVVVLLPFKLIATVVLYILKIVFKTISFIVFGCSLPFVLLSDIIGTILGLISAVGLAGMFICWRFGDLDGKTVLICAFTFGILSALFLAAEDIAAAIEEKLSDASDFFGYLIADMWT